MKRLLFTGLIVLLALSLVGCTNSVNLATPPQADGDSNTDEAAVRTLVADFGSKLKMVSLLAPADVLKKSLEDNYGGLVSPALLKKWTDNPTDAPGRLVSSPWPERIEITEVNKVSDKKYSVDGHIVEVTSAELESGGVAASRPVTLIVVEIEGKWVIDDVELGEYGDIGPLTCSFAEYGFRFYLPETWAGYSVVDSKWEGYTLDKDGNINDESAESGPLVIIRHPQWTEEKPRQDIPIMVFTLKQWESLEKGEFHIGAAPVNPSELGRNSKYVFALPARYNYAFPEGYEEVEDILEAEPLEVFEPVNR